jgi:predicted porin
MANGISTTTANDSSLTGSKLGLAYTYAQGSKAYFIHSEFKQEFVDAAANNAAVVGPIYGLPATLTSPVASGYRKQSNNLLGVQHRIGAWELHAAYAKQGNVKQYDGTELADSGSKAYTLGARYELSKRTALTVATTQIKNDKNNNINNSGGGQSSAAAIGYGSKLNQMGASIQHNF